MSTDGAAQGGLARIHRAYMTVVARFDATPELLPYRDTILNGRGNAESHYVWAATCNLDELLNWAEIAKAIEGGAS
jgi:hypothetical protein